MVQNYDTQNQLVKYLKESDKDLAACSDAGVAYLEAFLDDLEFKCMCNSTVNETT